MKRCVIIAGANIKNYERIKTYLGDNDYYIFCDSGLKHQSSLNIKADLILGDFDSYDKPDVNVKILELPGEKDDTDSVYAIRYALDEGFEEFLLIGMVGERFDHTIANVSMLKMFRRLNKKAMIVTDYEEMQIIENEVVLVDDGYAYFSLVNISKEAKGLTITNAKYNIYDINLGNEYQFTISNETIKGQKAQIEIKDGNLLLLKVFEK